MDDQDKAQKTEEPTAKRLQEARSKGQVATSQEVKHLFALSGLLLILLVFIPSLSLRLTVQMGAFLGQLHEVPVDAGALTAAFRQTARRIGLMFGLPLLILVVFAMAGSLVQHGGVFSAQSIKPELSKLSPLKGLKRLFSVKSLVEFLKGLVKLGVVALVGVAVISPTFKSLDSLAGLPTAALANVIWVTALRLIAAVLAVMVLIAGLDFLYTRFNHNQQLRMTKQEVKDEAKQADGDPKVKARLKQIRMERARRRIMAAVPKADVVITNPTHFAVAMAYDPDVMAAPRVVAKGADQLALRIKDIAREHGITIMENPPLARALFAAVEIDQEVPPEHYKAVAEVISYVFRQKKRPAKSSHG